VRRTLSAMSSWLGLLIMLLFGSGLFGTTESVSSEAASEAPAVEDSDAVRLQWEDHTGIDDCGVVENMTLGEPAPGEAKVWRCLADARDAGTAAEVTRLMTTVEGDPIYTYYRIATDGTLEIYEDGTQDAFGSQEWSFVQCPAPADHLKRGC
jgi:hypothetical protein